MTAPRGFTEEKEQYALAALRELKEELNVKDVNIKSDLGEIMSDSGVINFHIHVFEVHNINNIKVQRSEHILDYELVDFYNLCKMVNKNEIVDGFTIGGLFKWYLKSDF